MTAPRIAVGVDFSSEAELAAIEAREIARHLHEELVLVHAASRSEARAPAYDWLGRMRDRIASDGISIREGLIDGHAVSALGTAAREVGAEMIVVGPHGRHGLTWLLVGGIPERVIRRSDVDVLVARDEDPPFGGYGRVLVATDCSPSAERAYQRALALAAPDALIDVVHFFHGRPAPGIHEVAAATLGVRLRAAELERTVAAGQSFIGERHGPGPLVRLHAMEGAPIPGILDWLDPGVFDLVAVGSHGRRGVRRFLMGSVAEAIARDAPCSVLVARGR